MFSLYLRQYTARVLKLVYSLMHDSQQWTMVTCSGQQLQLHVPTRASEHFDPVHRPVYHDVTYITRNITLLRAGTACASTPPPCPTMTLWALWLCVWSGRACQWCTAVSVGMEGGEEGPV